MIAVVDYGMGNLRSVVTKLERLGVEVIATSQIEPIERATKLVLPGVGFFARGMDNLRSLGLVDVLNDRVLNKRTPVLGICLGMQLLTKRSQEGDSEGLGWIDAETVKIEARDDQNTIRIPHMGWNSVKEVSESPITSDLTPHDRFYFAHSYYVRCNDSRDVIATTSYGIDFASIIQRGNVFGTQFHPEKSHRSGMTLLKNFAELGDV